MNFSMNQGEVAEVFRVKGDAIDLRGELIVEDRMKFSASGTAQFPNGKAIHFSFPADEQTTARNRMRSACQLIATFYGVDLVHEKYEGIEMENQLLH